MKQEIKKSTLQSNNKTTKYMNNMKKVLADQQKINEAVKAVFNLFSDCPYATYVEAMAEAHTQIIGLMEMAKQQAAIHNANEEIQTSDITQFLMDVNSLYKVLRPFAEMVGDTND